MKKIMIAAAIVCAAAFAQASSCIWNSGTVSNGFLGPDDATMYNNGGSWTMTIQIVGITHADFSDSQSATTVKPNGSMGATTAKALVVGDEYSITATITGKDKNGKEWTREASAVTFTHASGSSNTSVNFQSSGAWGDWQSVPEPTSGLLLLLGVAGLALRRKQK